MPNGHLRHVFDDMGHKIRHRQLSKHRSPGFDLANHGERVPEDVIDTVAEQNQVLLGIGEATTAQQ